jgi:hypothetical protein
MRTPIISLAALSLPLLATGCGHHREPPLIREAEEAVRHDMLDPAATQFRTVQVCAADKAVVTGESNAKNSFGAYTGFKPFFYSGYHVSGVEDADFMLMMKRCYGPDAAVDPGQVAVDSLAEGPDAGTSDALASAGVVADTPRETARRPAGGRSRFPYVTKDGVNITSAADEANWKRYGTTDPGGGE